MKSSKRLSTCLCLSLCAALLCATAQAESLRVVALQVRVGLEDYFSPKVFAAKMDSLMARAMVHHPDLVIFPEDVGTFLLLSCAPSSARRAKTMREAMSAVNFGEAIGIGLSGLFGGASAPQALFAMRTPDMERAYSETFSRLASQSRVHIIAGSCCLVPKGAQGARNTAFVFDPQGRVVLRQYKVHLVDLEKRGGLDLSPGTVDALGVVKVKGAGIGVSVCYDTYFPDVTKALSAQGASVLVDIKANPWPYTPKEAKAFKAGLWRCVQDDPGIRYGVTSCLVGRMYDMVFEGRSAIVADAALTPDGSGYLAQAQTSDQEEAVAADLPLR